MKNRLLSYLLGGFLVILLNFSYGYVQGQECEPGDFSCEKGAGYPGTQTTQPGGGQQGGDKNPRDAQPSTTDCIMMCAEQIQNNGGDNGQCVSECQSNGQQSSSASSEKKECPKGCCGIKLNTNFPIIGDCIGDKESENPTNAFPTMIGAITKIVMSLVLVVCFIMIIVAGIMRAGDNPKGGKELIKKVAVTILVLGFSGVILRLINPNFFS